MKRTNSTLLSALLVAASVACFQCSGPADVAGGGTIETTNGVVGVIRNNNNLPSVNTVVKLFPENYDPLTGSTGDSDTVISATTDISGRYHFRRVNAGRYVILARNHNNETAFMIRDILVSNDSLTNAPEGTMNHPGIITLDFSSTGEVNGGYLFIPGTDIYSQINSNGSAQLVNVPPGSFNTVFLAFNGNLKRNVLRSEIILNAGDTEAVQLPLWQYSRTLGLNTTTTGAAVSGDVVNFPVLIRLNNDNFDFSQSRTDGTDLIFTDNNEKILTHQIERWDAGIKRAEIWVKVDTILGNDSTQSITMYWGNPAAALETKEYTVFDTSHEFQGVWHFEGTTEEPLRDATNNHFDGESPDSARPQSKEGIIGNCRIFDGIKNYFSMPNTAYGKLNIPQNRNYTVSAWAYLDTLDTQAHSIVSKGIEQYYLRSTCNSAGVSLAKPVWEFVEYNGTVGVQAPTFPAVSGKWVFLAGIRQGNMQLLYCNGELVDSITATPSVSSGSVLSDLFVGRFSKGLPAPANDGYCYFKGGIDEIRISSTARNSGWVRLSYMNQRSDDRLVIFK